MRILIIALFALVWAVATHASPIYKYRCRDIGADHGDDLKLQLEGRHAWFDHHKGTLDNSYGGGLSNHYDRFTGFEILQDEDEIELLVQKGLRRGVLPGRVRLQTRGETFYEETYLCDRLGY